MPTRDEIVALLLRARAQETSASARELFTQARDLSRELIRSGDEIEGVIWEARAIAELASESYVPSNRSAIWINALGRIDKMSSKEMPPPIAKAFARLAVDCFQDRYSDLGIPKKRSYLQHALVGVDEATSMHTGLELGELLACKSSILRQLSYFDMSTSVRKNRMNEAFRCCQRALREAITPAILLEAALAEWAIARYEASDELYAERLRAVETRLGAPELALFEPSQMTLARFYRETYRPLEACTAFASYLETGIDTRTQIRQSDVYAEAAIQIWFADYPRDIIEKHVRNAKELTERAIATGYSTARFIINLGFLTAILENSKDAISALREIHDGRGGIDWQEAARLIINSDVDISDFASRGFALGMDQGAVWTRLGTFAQRIMGDDILAEALYRTAIRLSPKDPVALTNLARHLLEKRIPERYEEAARLIQKAANFSDRRFVWWRAVRDQLQEESGVLAIQPSRVQTIETQALAPRVSTLEGLRKQFHLVQAMEDERARGYQLEKLIFQLAHLTVGTATPSYRTQKAPGVLVHQLDGFFKHDAEKYRVECKWRSNHCIPEHINAFATKLDVVGVSGLFISMSGFSEEAITAARGLGHQKAILLMDGDEARSAFENTIRFDELISLKRAHFDRVSNPYYKVGVIREAG